MTLELTHMIRVRKCEYQRGQVGISHNLRALKLTAKQIVYCTAEINLASPFILGLSYEDLTINQVRSVLIHSFYFKCQI